GPKAKGLKRVEGGKIAQPAFPPRHIPASKTASITANAKGNDTTYSRRNRNQITSNARRTRPAPKLTKSKRQGGRYTALKLNGNLERSKGSEALKPTTYRAAPNLATAKAIAAATQTTAPAAKLVP